MAIVKQKKTEGVGNAGGDGDGDGDGNEAGGDLSDGAEECFRKRRSNGADDRVPQDGGNGNEGGGGFEREGRRMLQKKKRGPRQWSR